MKHDELYFVERTYPVTIERLWQAWSDPAELEAWYSPVDLAVVPGSVANDVRVGGVWAVGVYVSKYSMPNAYFFGRYTEVEPLRKMVHTMHYTQDATEAAVRDESTPFHIIVIDFEQREDGAWCRFTQFGEMPEAQIELTRQGMSSYFENLARHLSGQP